MCLYEWKNQKEASVWLYIQRCGLGIQLTTRIMRTVLCIEMMGVEETLMKHAKNELKIYSRYFNPLVSTLYNPISC